MNHPVIPIAVEGASRERKRQGPKGRRATAQALSEVRALLGDASRQRDLLIEHLHRIQDQYHHLSADHLAALAEEMKLPQAAVYEVATFYHHFDVVKEGQERPAALTVRVCDGLSCELAGAQDLLKRLPDILGADVRVIPMSGWQRTDLWPALQREWVPPSPNVPRWETCFVYPGQVLLEGLSLSEGRGTTRPFEICGAPGIEPERLLAQLNQRSQPGLTCRALRFRPTFDKFAGQVCGGVALHVRQPELVRSFHWTLCLLQAVHSIWPERLQLLAPPYEYEYRLAPLDILYGSADLRHALTGQSPFAETQLQQLSAVDELAWFKRVSKFLLYE